MNTSNLTSEQVLEADITELSCSLSEADSFSYTLTDGEAKWLEFVRGRYAIADLLSWSIEPQSEASEPIKVTLNAWDVSRALNDDDTDRPACLSEDTALCRLCWACYTEMD